MPCGLVAQRAGRGVREWRLVGRVDLSWGPDIKSLLQGEFSFLGSDGQQAVAEACASSLSAGGYVLCFWLLLGLLCTSVLQPSSCVSLEQLIGVEGRWRVCSCRSVLYNSVTAFLNRSSS